MICQQLCGVNVLAFCKSPGPSFPGEAVPSRSSLTLVLPGLLVLTHPDSSTILRDANAPEKSALWLSWGIGLANFLFVADSVHPHFIGC